MILLDKQFDELIEQFRTNGEQFNNLCRLYIDYVKMQTVHPYIKRI